MSSCLIVVLFLNYLLFCVVFIISYLILRCICIVSYLIKSIRCRVSVQNLVRVVSFKICMFLLSFYSLSFFIPFVLFYFISYFPFCVGLEAKVQFYGPNVISKQA